MADYRGSGWTAQLPNHQGPPRRSGLVVAILSTVSVVLLIAGALYATLGPEPRAVVSVPAPIAKEQARASVPQIAVETVDAKGEAEGEPPAKHYAPDWVRGGPIQVTEAEAVAPAAEPAKVAKTATKTVVRLSARNKHSTVRQTSRRNRRAPRAVIA